MVSSVRVGSRGRIYVPEEVRKLLGIEEGDYIVIRKGKDGKLYIEKLV